MKPRRDVLNRLVACAYFNGWYTALLQHPVSRPSPAHRRTFEKGQEQCARDERRERARVARRIRPNAPRRGRNG